LNERAFSRIPKGFPMTAVPVSLSGQGGLVVLGRIPKDLAAEIAGGPLEFISLVFGAEDDIVDMQRIEITSPGSTSYLFQSRTPAGAGEYRCRLVVRNMDTGLAAVSSAPPTPIEPGGGRLRVLPLMLFAKRDEPVSRLLASGTRSAGRFPQADIYPLSSDELVPVLDGLEPGRELTVVVPCEAREGTGEDLSVTASLIDATTGERVPVYFYLKGRGRRESVQIVHLGIPAGTLEPGRFFLYVYVQNPASGETAYGRVVLTVSGG
jgi:hypothetical protein